MVNDDVVRSIGFGVASDCAITAPLVAGVSAEEME